MTDSTPMLAFHYHIFKNAGTSVDVMLKRNFGERWVEAEFPRNGPIDHPNVGRVEAFLRERPDLAALSSHTAHFPPPQVGRPVFPIVFVRHPLDRLKSAYFFERKQVADTHGARLAKQHDFAGYVRELLANPHFRQARNFQTLRLATNEPPENGTELERALRTLESLPFVGLVDAYDASIGRLGEMLQPHFPNFKPFLLHENRTAEQEGGLDDRIASMRDAMPAALFDELTAVNADDFAIYERARQKQGG